MVFELSSERVDDAGRGLTTATPLRAVVCGVAFVPIAADRFAEILRDEQSMMDCLLLWDDWHSSDDMFSSDTKLTSFVTSSAAAAEHNALSLRKFLLSSPVLLMKSTAVLNFQPPRCRMLGLPSSTLQCFTAPPSFPDRSWSIGNTVFST